MNRFLKSAAFPILIVILLVFVAQRLVVSGGDDPPPRTFNEFTEQIANDQVQTAVIKVENQEVKVQLKPPSGEEKGEEYTTGYPDDYSPQLVDQLPAANVPFEVEGRLSAEVRDL